MDSKGIKRQNIVSDLNNKDDSKDEACRPLLKKPTNDLKSDKSDTLELPDVSSIKFIEIQGERSSNEVMEYLSSVCESLSAERETSSHQQLPLLYKFKCTEEQSKEDHQKLNSILKNESAVLLLEHQSEGRTSIYWKSNKIEELLKLQHSKKLSFDEERKIIDFVADILARSLKNNHLGMISEFEFKVGLEPLNIELIADERNYNLLLLAVENENTEVVVILLKLDISATSQDNKVDAQTLAMERQHFEIVHALLQNNLKFPRSFDSSRCTEKLKKFCDITTEVHKLIKANKKQKLEVILNQHEKLRHFYNFENKSALRVAIKHKSLEVFDLLLSKNFRFGSQEKPADYFEKLDNSSKGRVRDIQDKYAQSFVENHIHILTTNSRAFYDDAGAEEKLNDVQSAFKMLNENPLIRIILMIVAASRNFKIVFDFNRDAVNVVDPTNSEEAQGVFYPAGYVLIGAKQLLNKETVNKTLAVLAHELCHFAMKLVYKNKEKPYKEDDTKTMEEFDKISVECKESKAEEEVVISSVFKLYIKEAHHAELIVRVVQLLVLYQGQPDKIAKVEENFAKLFKFYKDTIVPQMEKALPELKKQNEDIKDKKIYILKIILIVGGILSVVGILVMILIAFMLYTPIYKFDKLSIGNKHFVLNAPIRYKNTTIKLGELFPQNTTVFSNLTSNHIAQIFKRQVLDFDDSHLAYLNNQVIHSWANLTKKLKDKFLNSNFTFQNDSIKFKDLYKVNSKVFNSLSHPQILGVLDSKTLVVHEIIEPDTKFFFERKFWDENILEIYYDQIMQSVNQQIPFNSGNYDPKNTKKSNLTQTEKIKEIKKSPNYKPIQLELNQILNLVNNLKLFILKGEAGTGKTITFEHLTIAIKKKFPTKWVSYVNLKVFREFYGKIKTLKDVKEMLKKIFKLSSKNEFEMEIFDEFFDSGNLVLLWNRFDEIYPEFSEAVVNILGLIKNNTQNIQFICTRPLYSKLLKLDSDEKVYLLDPFDLEEREKYLKSFLKSLNVDDSKIQNSVSKIQKIINSTESDEDFDTPIMLGMLAELVIKDVEINETKSIYQIYQQFVYKKIEIWQNKSEFGREFLRKMATDYRGFSLVKLYQSFAIKFMLESNEFAYLYLLNLNVLRQNVPKELTNDEISRIGILYVNGPKTFNFAHKTFVEFFIAQYLIENVYNSEDLLITDEEAELRVALFKEMITVEGPRRFVDSYLKGETEISQFIPKIANVFSTKFRHLIFVTFRYETFKTLKVLINFIKKDQEILKSLLFIDEDETLFTNLITFNDKTYNQGNPGSNLQNLEIFKNFTKFSDFGYEKFINGKDQKGVILFSLYCYFHDVNGKLILHENYKLDDKLLENKNSFYVFESIVNNLTKNEFKKLLESGVILQKFSDENYQFNKSFISQIWNLIENKFNEKEQIEIFKNLFKKMQLPENSYVHLMTKNYFNFMGTKMERIFSKNDIFDLFTTNDVLFKLIGSIYDNFETFNSSWNLIVKFTTWDEQKKILQQKRNCSVGICNQFCFLLNRFTNLDAPKLIEDIYSHYFNKTEIQEIILAQSDFLMYFTSGGHSKLKSIVEYLQEIFKGNENSLRKFLLQKIKPSNKSIFEWSENYNFGEENVKILSDLLNNNTSVINNNK